MTIMVTADSGQVSLRDFADIVAGAPESTWESLATSLIGQIVLDRIIIGVRLFRLAGIELDEVLLAGDNFGDTMSAFGSQGIRVQLITDKSA